MGMYFLAVTRPSVIVGVQMEKPGALLGIDQMVAHFAIAQRRVSGECILISRISCELMFAHASLIFTLSFAFARVTRARRGSH